MILIYGILSLLWHAPAAASNDVVRAKHATVFSVQHLFCSFEGNANWTRTPSRSVQTYEPEGTH